LKLGKMLRRLRWWLIYLGPRRDVTVATFNGLLSFDSKDWLIGKYLYVNRTYEAREIQNVMTLLRQDGFLKEKEPIAVLDVGANIGMICIALLKHGYFQRAIAFEPTPNSYRLLTRNLRQNGLSDRVIHFPWALSSAEGEVEIELSADNSGDNRVRQTARPGAFREERRRAVTVTAKMLDQIWVSEPALSEERISLVWLDIQGHEGHFFLGAQDVLRKGVPVVTEFWPYGVSRSGVSRHQFCRIVSDLFTHFYVLVGENFEKHPISEIDGLFDLYSAPREMCLLVMVRSQ
jgi:FkbM family methyltransferase